MSTKTTGDYGETLACKYLQSLGYKIIERNYRIRGGEIDIIAQEKGDLVFIEVKTRHSHEFGTPGESITPWKINFLIRALQFYIVQHKKGEVPCRIDAVTVDFADDKQNPRIELIKNITN
jgi:putative endonuclease